MISFLKRGVMVFVFFIVTMGFLTGLVLATNTDQTILRISSFENAHGEIYSEANYEIDILYNEIFGENYTGNNPHQCDGFNDVLRLSGDSNAHAEGSLAGLNQTGSLVCYGDLRCSLTDIGRGTSGTCPQIAYLSQGIIDTTMVVKLSSPTNAHLARATSEARYGWAICCVRAGISPPPPQEDLEEEYYWADTEGLKISSAVEGNRVVAVVKTGIPNAILEFEIFEKDLIGVDMILEDIVLTTDSQGNAKYNWTIDLTGLSPEIDGKQEIYFRVDFEKNGQTITKTSNELSVPDRGRGGDEEVCNAFYLNNNNQQEYIEYCDDYNKIDGDSAEKRRQCLDDCNEVYETEISLVGGLEPSLEISEGYCTWKTISDVEKCRFEYDTGNPPENPLVCSQETTFGECVGGFRTATYNYIKISGTGDCPAQKTLSIPCPRSIELPLFGWAGLIISMIIIGIIYYNYFNKKKK